MHELTLRMLAFVAVLLMPFGMAPAPASPIEGHHVAMPMKHCPQQGSSRHSSGALADCTMACASALPATDLEIAGAHPLSKFIPEPTSVAALTGIELDIATPPPRRT